MIRALVVDTRVPARGPAHRDRHGRHAPSSSLAPAERSCFEDGLPPIGVHVVAVFPSCGRTVMAQPQDRGAREPHRP